jgi:hypothetical protein
MPAPKKRPTPAEQAARAKGRDADEQKAAKRQSLSTEGSRATYEQGEPTSPSYGGPLLLQVLPERAEDE